MKLPKNYHVYQLNRNILSNIIHKRGEAVCYTCGKQVEEGQKILSKSGGGNNQKHVLRHYDCAKQIGLI